MDIRILGPLEVVDHDTSIRLGGPRQRLVLANLAARSNRLVPVEQLIDEVWGEDPPPAATSTLHSYISRLRATLGDRRIEWRAPGYLLHVQPDELDALRFEGMLRGARARMTAEPEAAASDFVAALSLWRGRPFTDLAERGALLAEASRLDEVRAEAAEEWLELESSLGRDHEVVARAEELLHDHPLRERLWGLLMHGLYRSGRQAEALEAYHRLRRTLADELGIDPSPELQRLQVQILQQDPALHERRLQLRGYRLIEPIGEGMFGIVHRAIQPHVGREVALKAIRPRLAEDPDFIRRFEVEAQLVARLEHPRIVPLYDYWRDEYGAILVMRWLRGGSLRDALRAGPFSVPRALEVLEQVGEALAAAHRAGIVHRDLKPANVLLDEDGNAYLSDFGIAKDLAARRSEVTADYGSAYQSPEELRGEPTTPRSDIYALGILVYELLADRSPWLDDDRTRPTPLSTLRPAIGAPVDAILAGALAPVADERPESVEALLRDLRVALEATPAPARERMPRRNPYKGLYAFTQSDAADFFGRTALVDGMLGRLAENAPSARFLAVVGPSGSGKSSLVRAGLLPALRSGALPGSEQWFLTTMQPGPDPMRQLESALRRVAPATVPGLAGMLEHDVDGLTAAAHSMLPADASELVLVVDQLEEVFTLASSVERDRFLQLMTAAVRSTVSRVRVIVTLRADFYHRPLVIREFAELVGARTQVVTPPSAAELEQVISGPLQVVGGAAEPALVPALLAESLDRPGGLPLLEYTLSELFEQSDGSRLTVSALNEMGGVSGAIARRAEAAYAELTGDEQAALRRVMLGLVTITEGGMVTRRRVHRAELGAVGRAKRGEAPTTVEAALEAFGRHRFLTFDHDPVTRAPTVEVAHEALLVAWRRLANWLDDARDEIALHRRLGDQARAWLQAGRDESFLARGGQLAGFAGLARRGEIALTAEEQDFLDASTAARQVEAAAREAQRRHERELERRSIRRLRWLAASLATGAAVAIGLSVFALLQVQATEREARLTTARRLAAAAVENLQIDPDLSINLAIEAVEITRLSDGTVLREAQEALHSALLASRVIERLDPTAGVIPDHTGGWYSLPADGGIAVRQEWTDEELVVLAIGVPDTLAVSRTAERVATAGDGVIRVWDASSAAEVASIDVGVVRFDDIAFSPDGLRLAARWFGGAAIWDIDTGHQVSVALGSVEGHGINLDWSPDGSLLAIAVGGAESETLVVSSADGSPVRTLPGHGRTTVFSPDGGLLLTTGQDDGVLWDTATWSQRFILPHSGWVDGSAFSHDGRLAATGADDGIARVWDTASGEQLFALPGAGGRVGLVVFDPASERLAGWTSSGGLVWNLTVAGNRVVQTWANPHGVSFNVSAGPRGRLVTGGATGASLWAPGGQLLAEFEHDGAPVADIVVSPGGDRVASVGFDGTVRLWSDSGQLLDTYEGHTGEVWGVAFSPDGSMLASVATDGTGRVWNLVTGTRGPVFTDHHDNVWDVAWSPADALVVSVGDDGMARQWDPISGDAGPILEGHTGGILEQAFSPDGRQVATASFDGTAIVWDVASGDPVFELVGHTGVVTDVEASPNGSRWMTGSVDGTVRIWDAATGVTLLTLEAQTEGPGLRLAFLDDDRIAVAGNAEIRIYTLDVEDLLAIARERATRSLTPAECRQYLQRDGCA